jgi:hypothetical protein
MIPWNPTPAGAHGAPHRRPIDRPAVAVILTIALVLGALLGLYAAHVLHNPSRPDSDKSATSARQFPGIEPVCRTYRRGNVNDAPRRYVPRVPCHTTTTTRGTV